MSNQGDDSSGRPLQAVLFICSFNAVRSPMAEALLKRMCGSRIYVQSCGHTGGQDVDGFAVAVMKELDTDISQHTVRALEDLNERGFDLIIALSEQALEVANELAELEDADVEYWSTPDPTAISGNRDERLSGYRKVRDGLDDRIRKRFAQWVTNTVK